MAKQIYKFRTVENILRTLSDLYTYNEIKTPMFENIELFKKSVGENSDIITKEIYNFFDKGNRELALRPEGTASAIRHIVENKRLLGEYELVKLFYFGEMFRYERPQSGRQREFNQFGIECVGNFNEYDEIEIIFFANTILQTLSITDYVLEINNLGSNESRIKWVQELTKYFDKYRDQLTEDSINRLDKKNPLRILDDKVDGLKDFVINAPKLNKFLTDEENEYFKKIIVLLKKYNIDFKVNENLVRGLDYYNGLVFEFISHNELLKSQSTLIGGGRYDSLVKNTGGPDVKGIGFALGVERVIIAIGENQTIFSEKKIDVVLLPLSSNALNISVILSNILRLNGISCCISNKTFKLDKHFKYVNKYECSNVIILGDKELEKEEIIIKNQITKKEEKIKIKDLVKYFKK